MKEQQIASNNEQSLIESVRVEYLDGGELKILDAKLTDLPAYKHGGAKKEEGEGALSENAPTDSWQMQINGETVNWSVTLESIPTSRSLAKDVSVTLSDLRITVRAEYPSPKPEFEWDPRANETVIGETTTDTMTLSLDKMEDLLTSRSILQTRKTSVDGVSIETRFYWPPPPVGATAGYTAPAEQWDETIITGLTTEPIILKDFWSQTYLPGHHNFTETFLFEPRLSPTISAATLAELTEQGIAVIVLDVGQFDGPGIRYIEP